MAFSPAGRLLAAGSGHGDARVVLWDVTDPAHPARTATVVLHRRRRWEMSPDSTIHALGFSPNGRLLALSSQRHGVTSDIMVASGPSVSEVSLWDITDAAQPARTATLTRRRVDNKQQEDDHLDTVPTPTVHALGFSIDGSLLATGSAHGTLTLWDVTDPTQPTWTATLTDQRGVRATGFSPDGRLLVACGDNSVTLWRISP